MMGTLWHMTVSGAALIAAIACLRALFLEKLDKGLFPVLWLVAAARLLIPLSVPVPVPALVLAAAPAAAGGNAPANGGFPWLTALWLTGAAAMAAVILCRHVRALRRYAQALPVEDGRVTALVTGFGLRRPVSVRVCQAASTPLTYGFLQPVILLPKGWKAFGRQELDLALTHELTHIRRLDVPAKYILAAAVCVHWFNPFVWAMYALAEQDIELACDEAVLRRMTDGRAAYAAALIGLEQRRSQGGLLSGFGFRAVQERVTQIMRYRRRGLRGFFTGAAIALCSLAVFVTAAAAGTVPLIEPASPSPTPAHAQLASEEEPAVTTTPAPAQWVSGGPALPDRGTPPPAGVLPERAAEGQ